MSNQNSNNQPPADPNAQAVVPANTDPKKGPVAPPTPKGSRKIRANVTAELMAKEFVPPEKKAANLANAVWHATKQYSFMGTVLQCLNISYVHTIPTAGVMFNNDMKRWDLLINPNFFCNKLNDPQRVAVLMHELYHITHKHPFRAPFMKLPQRKRLIMNIAADMAINQYITGLPKGCQSCPPIDSKKKCTNEQCAGRTIDVADFFDEDEKTKTRTPWPTKKTMEFYYEKLLERFDDPEDDDE